MVCISPSSFDTLKRVIDEDAGLLTFDCFVIELYNLMALRACFAYEDFSKRGRLLTNKMMLQGYNESRLKSSFRKFYGRYNDLVCGYNLSLAHMLNDLFHTIC